MTRSVLYLLVWYTYNKCVQIIKNCLFWPAAGSQAISTFHSIYLLACLYWWNIYCCGLERGAIICLHWMIDAVTQLLQEMNNLLLSFFWYCLITEFVCVSEVKCFFLINSPSPRNEHKWNKAQIYDGMVQIYFSLFEARRNYIVHLLSWDFEVLLCPGWIRIAQSVWATSWQNLSSDLNSNSPALFQKEVI